MIVKNIYGEEIELLGKKLDDGEEALLHRLWKSDTIYKRKDKILAAWKAGAIAIKYINGETINKESEVMDVLCGQTPVAVSSREGKVDNGMFYILIDRFYAKEDEWDVRPIVGAIYKMRIRASQKTYIRFMKDGELVVEQIIHRLLPIDVNPTLGYEIDEIQFKGVEKKSSIRVEIEAYTRGVIANSEVGKFVNDWSN